LDFSSCLLEELGDRDVNAKGFLIRELHKKKIEENMSSVS
jgi:hypothetical protein